MWVICVILILKKIIFEPITEHLLLRYFSVQDIEHNLVRVETIWTSYKANPPASNVKSRWQIHYLWHGTDDAPPAWTGLWPEQVGVLVVLTGCPDLQTHKTEQSSRCASRVGCSRGRNDVMLRDCEDVTNIMKTDRLCVNCIKKNSPDTHLTLQHPNVTVTTPGSNI